MRREEQPAKRARIMPPLTDSAQGEMGSGGVALAPVPWQHEMLAKEELIKQFARIMITFFHRTDPARLPTKTQLRKYSHDQLASMIGAFNRSVE